jgi:hypothetical protein
MRFSCKLIILLLLFPAAAFGEEDRGWRETWSTRVEDLARRTQELIAEGVDTATEASRQARDWTADMLSGIGDLVAPAYDRTFEAVSEHSRALSQQTVLALSEAYNYSFDFSNSMYESLSQNLTSGANYLVEVSSDGGLQIFEASSDGLFAVSQWSQERISQMQQIDYCEIDLIDTAGGLAAGVAVTSLFSGVNITGASLIAIPTMSGWLPVLAPLVSPAIPAGISLAAGAGVLIYASTKGYCWMIAPAEEDLSSDVSEVEEPIAEAID